MVKKKSSRALLLVLPGLLVLTLLSIFIHHMTTSVSKEQMLLYVCNHAQQRPNHAEIGVIAHDGIPSQHPEETYLYLLPADASLPEKPIEMFFFQSSRFLGINLGRHRYSHVVAGTLPENSTEKWLGSYLYRPVDSETKEKADTQTLLLFGTRFHNNLRKVEYTTSQNGTLHTTTVDFEGSYEYTFLISVSGLGKGKDIERAFVDAKFYDANDILLYTYTQ